MKALIIILCGWALVPVINAAVIATPITPYRSLSDSPWYAGVAAGDALLYTEHTYAGGVPILPPPGSIPSGHGVYDAFENAESPWVQVLNYQENPGFSVDADDGILDYQGLGHSIAAQFVAQGLRFEFLPMDNGEYPRWVGFVSLLSSNLRPASLEILGVDDSITTIDLTSLVAQQGLIPTTTFTDNDLFAGFISDRQIKRVTLFGGGFVVDHFQYGYGAFPIPESSSLVIASCGCALFLRRKRPSRI